ncbi:putative phosphothreonine lyase domain-containg protein [Burkholderia ubonensis]|nr:putative phosphothreonine lyase domain-containg protein [Burkholderia ubonensis]
MSRVPSNPKLQFFWLHSQPEGNPFYSKQKSGKWCLCFTAEEVDEAWARIDALVAAGKVRAAIASTLWGSQQRGFDTLVICVFTEDWEDRDEVRRVRQLLLDEGFTTSMGYKRDIDTVQQVPGQPEFIYTDADILGTSGSQP